MKSTHLNSGDLALAVGVNKETLRFYERKGLLRKPERTEAGYRLFDSTDVERLSFIKNAKSLGFSLSEIKQLISIAMAASEAGNAQQSKVPVEVKSARKLITFSFTPRPSWFRTVAFVVSLLSVIVFSFR